MAERLAREVELRDKVKVEREHLELSDGRGNGKRNEAGRHGVVQRSTASKDLIKYLDWLWPHIRFCTTFARSVGIVLTDNADHLCSGPSS